MEPPPPRQFMFAQGMYVQTQIGFSMYFAQLDCTWTPSFNRSRNTDFSYFGTMTPREETFPKSMNNRNQQKTFVDIPVVSRIMLIVRFEVKHLKSMT